MVISSPITKCIILIISLLTINCCGPTRTVSTKAQLDSFKKEIALPTGQTQKPYLGSTKRYHYFYDAVYLNLLSPCHDQMAKVRVKKSLAPITPETQYKPFSKQLTEFNFDGTHYKRR